MTHEHQALWIRIGDPSLQDELLLCMHQAWGRLTVPAWPVAAKSESIRAVNTAVAISTLPLAVLLIERLGVLALRGLLDAWSACRKQDRQGWWVLGGTAPQREL